MGHALPAPVPRTSEQGQHGPGRRAPRAHHVGWLAPVGTRAWIDRAARLYYVHPRTVGRRAQLCLRAPDGCELGWKDVASGRVMVRDPANRGSLVRAILEAAGPAHVPLSSDNLPGVALDIPGGTVLAQLRLRSAAILVGKESPEGEGHRLYATFAQPGKCTVTLGYMDLGTGSRHRRPEAGAALDPETADQLLDALVEHRPTEHYP